MLRSFNSSALYSSTTLYLFPPDADEPPLTLPVSTFLPSSNSDLVVHDDNTPNDEASPSIVSLLRVSSIPGNPDSLQLLLLQTTSTTTSKTLLTLSLQTGQIESTSSASPSTSDISPNGCTFVSVTSREITVTTDTTFTISKKFDEDISTARFLTNDMLVVITSNSKTYRFTCLKIPPPQPPVEQGWLDWSLKLIHLRSPTLKSIYICEGSKKSVYVSSNTITSINLNGRIEVWCLKGSEIKQIQYIKYPKILKNMKTLLPVGINNTVFLVNEELREEFIFTSSPLQKWNYVKNEFEVIKIPEICKCLTLTDDGNFRCIMNCKCRIKYNDNSNNNSTNEVNVLKQITTQKRSVSVDVKINEKAVDLIKDLRDLESLTSYLHTILESIKGVKVIEDILEKLRIRGDEIGCGIEINKVVEDVEICKNVWTVLVSSLGKGDEVECEDEEIKTYVDYLINDKIEEECITLNEIFKCYRKKGSFRKNSKFLKLLYGPVLWDVFWSKNIEDIEIKLNLNRIECCEGILLGLNSSELKMDLGKLISFIVRKGRDNDEVRMLEFHNTVKESLNLSTENIVRGFIWSKKASSVVEEITEKMERKTMGDIGKWDGREWREIESTARKLILLGDDVYGKIVEEQIHLKDVEECLKIEKLCLGCKLGSEIKEKYKTSEQENDYLSKNWSSVFSTVHSRKDEHINVMFVSDTSLKKPLQIHLPRYNNKSMLALRRAELLACTWRSELSHTALILKAISNLEIVDSRIPRAAVSRAIFAMMSPIIRLLICNDFSNAVGFEEEDFENEEGTSILNDKKWAREVLKVGKRLLEFINDKGGGGDKVVGAVVEDRVVSELTQNFVTNATNINSLMLHNSFIIAATLMLDHGDEDCDVSLSEVFLLTLEDIVMDSCDFFVLNSLCLEPHSEGRQNQIRDNTAVANLTELQRVFLNKTIRESPNRLNMLYELGAAWGTTRGVVNTVYITAMWWIGGDGEVEEIVANGLSGGIDAEVLVREGVHVSCWRLQKLIDGFRKEKTLKLILGTLDADTTMYVKDVAAQIESNRKEEERKLMSVGATHHIILHLLRYSRRAEAVEEAEKVHALSILSNQLLDQSLKFIERNKPKS